MTVGKGSKQLLTVSPTACLAGGTIKRALARFPLSLTAPPFLVCSFVCLLASSAGWCCPINFTPDGKALGLRGAACASDGTGPGQRVRAAVAYHTGGV